MRKAIFPVLVSILIGVVGEITTIQSFAATPCNVSGLISTDTIWSPNQCDYYVVTGNVLVQAGTSLTIEPGTIVRFNHLKAMTVQGKLVAVGTANSPIIFSSNLATPAKGDWGYILFTDTSIDNLTCAEDGSGSIVKYANLQYGGGANTSENGVLRAVSSAPCFTYNIIRNNNADGIHVWNSTDPMQIAHNRISENGDVLQSIEARGIYYTSNAVDTHVITANNVLGNTGTGIELLVAGTAMVMRNSISSNKNGLVLTVYGPAGVYYNSVTENLGLGMLLSADTLSIKGNTISDNYDTGIKITSYHTSVVENVISNNVAHNRGGGFFLDNAPPGTGSITFVSNTITGNVAASGGGIAVSSISSDVSLINNVISNNLAGGAGGIGSNSRTLFLDGNTIIGNVAFADNGGGLHSTWAGEVTIVNNNIISNTTVANGGGMFIGGKATISNNTLSNNSAENGGAMYLDNSSNSSIASNTVIGNFATQSGGAIVLSGGASISDNVFAENSATKNGGAIYYVWGGTTTINNNIIRNNLAKGLEGRGGGIFLCGGCSPEINNNDICLNNDAFDGDLYNDNSSGTPDINVLNNYWGDITNDTIEDHIWHFLDDSAKGIVLYIPFRIEPASGDPDICQSVVSPSCNLKLDLDYNGVQLLLHYDMYTGETPVQWRNYSFIEDDMALLWSQNLPAELTYQDTISVPFPNSGLVTVYSEFWTNEGVVCSDVKSIITRGAQ